MSDNGLTNSLISTGLGAQTQSQVTHSAVMGNPQKGLFQVDWDVTIRDGRRALTGLSIGIHEDCSLAWAEITTDFLRILTVEDLLARSQASYCRHANHGHDNSRRPYQRITDDDLQQLIDVYNAAEREGRSGNEAVRDSFGVTAKAAERLILKADRAFPCRMPSRKPGRRPKRAAQPEGPPQTATTAEEPDLPDLRALAKRVSGAVNAVGFFKQALAVKLFEAAEVHQALTDARGQITDTEHSLILEEMIDLVTELFDTGTTDDDATAIAYNDQSGTPQ